VVSRAHGHRLRNAWTCTIAVIMGGGCAARQPARSFLDLQERLHSGNTVYVTDKAGTETKGEVVDVSASALVLDVNGMHRRMDQSSVQYVQRRGDSLWNGMLIGVAVGASAMLIPDPRYEPCTNDTRKLCANSQIGQRVLAVGIMGAAGAGLDALISRRHFVYLAPGERPPVARAHAVSAPLTRSNAIAFVAPDSNRRPMVVCDSARPIVQLVSCVQAGSAVTNGTSEHREGYRTETTGTPQKR
jgi:hypothetical protein